MQEQMLSDNAGKVLSSEKWDDMEKQARKACADASVESDKARGYLARMERAAVRDALHAQSPNYCQRYHDMLETLPNGKELATAFRKRLPALCGAIMEVNKKGVYVVDKKTSLVQFLHNKDMGYVFACIKMDNAARQKAISAALVEPAQGLADLALLSVKVEQYKEKQTPLETLQEKAQALLDYAGKNPTWLDYGADADNMAAALSFLSYYSGLKPRKSAETYAARAADASKRGQDAKAEKEAKEKAEKEAAPKAKTNKRNTNKAA